MYRTIDTNMVEKNHNTCYQSSMDKLDRESQISARSIANVNFGRRNHKSSDMTSGMSIGGSDNILGINMNTAKQKFGEAMKNGAQFASKKETSMFQSFSNLKEAKNASFDPIPMTIEHELRVCERTPTTGTRAKHKGIGGKINRGER